MLSAPRASDPTGSNSRGEQLTPYSGSVEDLEAIIKGTARLRRLVLSRKATIGVVGQGYVGLSVGLAAADAGFPVIGLDLDAARIKDLNDGVLSVAGVPEDLFARGVGNGRISFTTDPAEVAGRDIVLICVPTPVKDHSPDLSYIEGASLDVGKELSAGSLVVLESTTYPGTTDDLVAPLLEQASGLRCGQDFLLAYSPERIDPGNTEYDFRGVPRVVGGVTPEATGVASLFYGQLVDKVVVVSSCRAAELAKLIENTFRHVNVALINEMAMLCNDMSIPVWEVIDAAASKPFGFMPFYPGPGVGGHCIPLDPTYLSWQVRRQAGRQFRILEQAQDVNAQMPAYVSSRIADTLNDVGKAVRKARILVLGVTYKPDVGDIRESPALKVMGYLAKRGAAVEFHDPFVESVELEGRTIERSELSMRRLARADCVALLTPHSSYDLDWIADHAPVIFDARNAYGEQVRRQVVPL